VAGFRRAQAKDQLAMAYVRTILIVDGDNATRETLREQLTRDDAFAVVEARNAHEAECCLTAQDGPFAAVIMDAALPDGDGHEVCAQLRAKGMSMPVILMNGSSQSDLEDDTITIAKPFRLSELMARLRARLDARETTGANGEPATIKIGPYDFSLEDKSLRHDIDNLRIRLTEKEAAILAFLHTNERPVPRRELLKEVWGYNPAVTTHTLETHIYRLRRKIEVDPAKARLLITEGGGYRLAAR
jgi:DNA-binding response OmpR family regulator